MIGQSDLWVIILAAGDGRRVRSLTTDADGLPAPKQFCSIFDTESMLRCTVKRASCFVSMQRIVVVVAGQHRRWWSRDLADLPPENIVVQPADRGTASGLLLPYMEILRRDHGANLLVLPSDHYVQDEEVLRDTIQQAVAIIEQEANRVVLLGIEPDQPDSSYGWIVPSELPTGGPGRRVAAFIEKPDRARAETLMQQGGLYNSFILAASGEALTNLYKRTVPELAAEFHKWQVAAQHRTSLLHNLYDAIPTCDFSRQILEKCADRLLVLPVSPCGWQDLGTPARLVPLLDHRTTRRHMALAAQPTTRIPGTEVTSQKSA
jgi:mannose-1-phosphate guanylyltransferase